MKHKFLLSSIAFISILTAPIFGSNAKAAQLNDESASDAKAAYVIDAKSGQILYQKNANQKLPIASLAKIMTLYLTSDAIKNKKIQWNEETTISKPLITMSNDDSLGSFKMKATKKYSIRQLYQAALVASSNSAAITLGEKVAGNNNRFIDMMNEQSKKWHLNAHFVSSSGLENYDLKKFNYEKSGSSNKDYNQVSAKAITTVAQKLVDDYPYVKDWSSKHELTVAGEKLTNSNRLLKGDSYYVKDHHVDGLKTGYTEQAGLCLITTYYHDGRQLIATILGSNSSFSTTNTLIDDINENLTYGAIPVKTRVYKQQNTEVKATPTENKVKMWHDAEDPNKGIETSVKKDVTNNDPVAKGEKIATAKVDSKNYPYQANVKLVADKNVGSKERFDFIP